MLSDDLWEELGLEPDVLRQRAWFFSAYAGAVAEHPRLDVDARADSAPLTPRGDAPRLVAFGDMPPEEGARVSHDAPLVAQSPWMERAEMADAWREAALAALPVEIPEGMDYLTKAGYAYLAAGSPYGLFLRVVTDESYSEAAWVAAEYLHSSIPSSPEAASGGSREEPLGSATRVPAQQLALLFAAASNIAVAQEYRRFGERLLEAPQAKSSTSFGSTGVALGEWWGLGVDLFMVDGHGAGRRSRLRDRMAHLGTIHGEMLERARWDRFHWRTARARVDLLDLDLATIVCLADRRLRAEGDVPLSARDFADIAPLARVSLEIGIQMAAGNDEPRSSTSAPAGL